jgi:hypothetical protein
LTASTSTTPEDPDAFTTDSPLFSFFDFPFSTSYFFLKALAQWATPKALRNLFAQNPLYLI